MAISAREKAVQTLLKPPAVRYLRRLKISVDSDPGYLRAHREDIGNIITGFLTGAGFQWHRAILEREWSGILDDALALLAAKKRR